MRSFSDNEDYWHRSSTLKKTFRKTLQRKQAINQPLDHKFLEYITLRIGFAMQRIAKSGPPLDRDA